MPPRPLIWILVCAVGLMMTGCRLDVAVDVVLEADGTGQVQVVVTADRALTDALPPGAELLIWDDARAAGWEVSRPELTDDAGREVRVQRPFASMDDLATALSRIGPFLSVESLRRTATVDGDTASEIRTELRVRAGLADGDTLNGFAAFSDPDLDAVMGGTPFGEELAASGATPATSMGLQIRMTAPGDLERTTGSVVDSPEGFVTALWQIPLDGSVTEVVLVSVQRPAGAWWAGTVARVLSVLVMLWVALAIAILVLVAVARQRRARRRRARAARVGRHGSHLRS